jgi:hypothetical protein
VFNYFLVRPPRVVDSYKCRPFSKMNSLLSTAVGVSKFSDSDFPRPTLRSYYLTLAHLFEARAQCYFDGFKNYKCITQY